MEITLPKKSNQQQVWDLIRTELKGQEFTRRIIQDKTGLGSDEIDGRFLSNLVKHGFLTFVKNEPKTYLLEKPASVDCPRFTAKGALIVESSVNHNIWRAMRINRTFTINELVIKSRTSKKPTTHKTVSSYVRKLKAAGYLVVVDVMKLKEERLMLVRDSGPKPPQILRIKEVFDPNLNKIMYREVPDAE